MTHVLGTRHTTVDLNDLTAVPYLNRYWQLLGYIHTFTHYNTLKADNNIINTH
jgi:aryl carrier-like protein